MIKYLEPDDGFLLRPCVVSPTDTSTSAGRDLSDRVPRRGAPVQAVAGERGLQPVPDFLKRTPFRAAPSLFFWRYSDRLADVVGWTGVALSSIALLGISERSPIWLSMGVWLLLWVLYLSI